MDIDVSKNTGAGFSMDRLAQDAVCALRQDSPELAKRFVAYALEHVLNGFEVICDLPCYFGDKSVTVDYACFSDTSVKLVEFIWSQKRYNEDRLLNLKELCEFVNSDSTGVLADELREKARESKLLCRKNRLEIAYEQIKALPATQNCEIVYITPDMLPWFALDGVTRCTLGEINKSIFESELSAVLGAIEEGINGR